MFIEAVHRLNDLGAVVTHAAHGTSQDGFEAEWRDHALRRSKATCVNRCEVFDEADLDTALARFDELDRPARRLENAASHAVERLQAHFAARDWNAMAEMLADDISTDDRRRVVGAGSPTWSRCRDRRHARGRQPRDSRADHATPLRPAGSASSLSVRCAHDRAARGVSRRDAQHRRDQRRQADRALVTFDVDDIDAAFAELDARYPRR